MTFSVSQLSEDLALDKSNCELRVLGRRQVVVDMQRFCENLELMVGPKVAEVIVNQHEIQLGREDAESLRKLKPQASVQEILDSLAEIECLSGVGRVNVTLPKNEVGPVDIEMLRPCMKRTTGAAKAFLFSYWCGVLRILLGRDFKVSYAVYHEDKDLTRCQLTSR
jgi:hypothetical protein